MGRAFGSTFGHFNAAFRIDHRPCRAALRHGRGCDLTCRTPEALTVFTEAMYVTEGDITCHS